MPPGRPKLAWRLKTGVSTSHSQLTRSVMEFQPQIPTAIEASPIPGSRAPSASGRALPLARMGSGRRRSSPCIGTKPARDSASSRSDLATVAAPNGG